MRLLKQIIFLAALLLAISCNNSDEVTNNGTAKLSVKLVDDPGDYENVFVEVIDVMVKYENDDIGDDENDEDNENGWESIGIINPGIYDLLELTGGQSLELVDNEDIATGTIKQIRLILGDDNSVVLEGETEPLLLSTPSAQQSGLKVMVNQPIVAGFNYDFILDFDVDESIVMAGNSGNIILKPVLRANLEVNSGNIEGNILPADVVVEVSASNGVITASTFTTETGNFEIIGLPAGIYTVTIVADDDSMLNPVTLEDIEVEVGETTTIDPIVLE